jgi:hypothetical protein
MGRSIGGADFGKTRTGRSQTTSIFPIFILKYYYEIVKISTKGFGLCLVPQSSAEKHFAFLNSVHHECLLLGQLYVPAYLSIIRATT